MARFILMPDPADDIAPGRFELFADVADLNTVPKVADAFGVCPQTVRRLIASGELASVHVGRSVRVTKRAMIEFIESQGVTA